MIDIKDKRKTNRKSAFINHRKCYFNSYEGKIEHTDWRLNMGARQEISSQIADKIKEIRKIIEFFRGGSR